jgi:uncharacterized protein YdeI (YjbR/CyaY-like superfamily)
MRRRCNNAVVDVGTILSAADRSTWRRWLAANYHTQDEIWLQYHRAHTGKPRVAYNDAVEEALCFGWIDSTVKSIDEDSYAQRFTPRGPRSNYSQTNKERLRRLIDLKQVTPEVAARVTDVLDEPFVVPRDIETALRVDPIVWQNFKAYSDGCQRIRIAYVDSARNRQDEFDKRLANLLRKTAADSQFGFDIESYY